VKGGDPSENKFLVGGENSKPILIKFDPNAKYEAWII
jgi:hypothetical protein